MLLRGGVLDRRAALLLPGITLLATLLPGWSLGVILLRTLLTALWWPTFTASTFARGFLTLFFRLAAFSGFTVILSLALSIGSGIDRGVATTLRFPIVARSLRGSLAVVLTTV